MDAVQKGKKIDVYIIVAVFAVAILASAGIKIYNLPSSRLSRQLDLGQKYLREAKYEEAVAAYEMALSIDDKCVEAYLGLADAYIGLGDSQRAISLLERGAGITADARLSEKRKDLLQKTESTYAQGWNETPNNGENGDTDATENILQIEPRLVYAQYLAALEDSESQFALADLTGDGTEELIYYTYEDGGYTLVVTVVTLENGEIVELATGAGNAPAGILLVNGNAIATTFFGSDFGGTTYLVFEDGTVKETEVNGECYFDGEGAEQKWVESYRFNGSECTKDLYLYYALNFWNTAHMGRGSEGGHYAQTIEKLRMYANTPEVREIILGGKTGFPEEERELMRTVCKALYGAVADDGNSAVWTDEQKWKAMWMLVINENVQALLGASLIDSEVYNGHYVVLSKENAELLMNSLFGYTFEMGEYRFVFYQNGDYYFSDADPYIIGTSILSVEETDGGRLVIYTEGALGLDEEEAYSFEFEKNRDSVFSELTFRHMESSGYHTGGSVIE